MKVLHLAAFDTLGGASKGSYGLHRAMIAGGVDSHMLTARKDSDDPAVIGPRGLADRARHRVTSAADRLPLKLYPKAQAGTFSPGLFGSLALERIKESAPDIVHLHWVCRGFATPGQIARVTTKLGLPVVWTLRDMWAFTGGCHYSGDCDRYQDSCGRCPQLAGSRQSDLSGMVWKKKMAAYRRSDLHVVAIGSALAEAARRSSLLRNVPIETIPNSIDHTLFQPVAKDNARKQLGISQDRRVLVFGAVRAFGDRRKGGRELLEALKILSRNGRRITLLVFGDDHIPPELQAVPGLEVVATGYVNDVEQLCRIYSSGDVMVVPSLQEAFGKTAAEAQACGIPVVGFQGTGVADIVEDGRTGRLATHGDVTDLAECLAWVLERSADVGEDDMTDLGRAARERVVERFSAEVVVSKYLELYENILSRQGRDV